MRFVKNNFKNDILSDLMDNLQGQGDYQGGTFLTVREPENDPNEQNMTNIQLLKNDQVVLTIKLIFDKNNQLHDHKFLTTLQTADVDEAMQIAQSVLEPAWVQGLTKSVDVQ